MINNMQLLPTQCRAARALLDWSQLDLANASDVALRTIVDFERSARSPQASTRFAIRSAFEAAGIEFIDPNGGGAGVRFKEP